MPKPNVYGLVRPKPDIKTVTLRSDGNEDITLPIRRLPLLEFTAATRETAEGYAAKYIHGKWTDDDGQEMDHPMTLPPVGGEPVFVTDATCRTLAAIEAAQVGDDPFTFEELAAIASVDGFHYGLMEAFAASIPNAPREEKPSPKELTGTPSTSSP